MLETAAGNETKTMNIVKKYYKKRKIKKLKKQEKTLRALFSMVRLMGNYKEMNEIKEEYFIIENEIKNLNEVLK